MHEVFVGRQPIFDRQLDIVGYELLFRHCYEADHAEFDDVDMAGSQVILNTFIEIGLTRLVENKLAFINLTRNFFLDKSSPSLPKDRVVLEVLENTPVDNKLIKALKTFNENGYRIALDDVTDPNKLGQLLNIARMVKVDLAVVDQSRLGEYVGVLRKHDVRLIAEKVETLDDFDKCRNLGFDYFQGFFLCKPNVVMGRRMPNSHLTILRLLSKIQDPNLEFSELEQIVRNDVSLSYKLLRLINSAFYVRPVKIKSIRDALTLLGLKQIRGWLSLLLLSKIDDKPNGLMVIAMVRGKMCELVAQALGKDETEMEFIVGLFSVLDALLDLPMEEITKSLPLSDEIVSALLRHEGQPGAILQCVLAYERAEWEKVRHTDLEPRKIRDAYLESLEWAGSVGSLLKV